MTLPKVRLGPSPRPSSSQHEARQETEALKTRIKDFRSRWDVRSVTSYGDAAARDARVSAARGLLSLAGVLEAGLKATSRSEIKHILSMEVDWSRLLPPLISHEASSSTCMTAMTSIARVAPGLMTQEGTATALCALLDISKHDASTVSLSAQVLLLQTPHWRVTSLWKSEPIHQHILHALTTWMPQEPAPAASKVQPNLSKVTNRATTTSSTPPTAMATPHNAFVCLDVMTAVVHVLRLQLKLSEVSYDVTGDIMDVDTAARWCWALSGWLSVAVQQVQQQHQAPLTAVDSTSGPAWELAALTTGLFNHMGAGMWDHMQSTPALVLQLVRALHSLLGRHPGPHGAPCSSHAHAAKSYAMCVLSHPRLWRPGPSGCPACSTSIPEPHTSTLDTPQATLDTLRTRSCAPWTCAQRDELHKLQGSITPLLVSHLSYSPQAGHDRQATRNPSPAIPALHVVSSVLAAQRVLYGSTLDAPAGSSGQPSAMLSEDRQGAGTRCLQPRTPQTCPAASQAAASLLQPGTVVQVTQAVTAMLLLNGSRSDILPSAQGIQGGTSNFGHADYLLARRLLVLLRPYLGAANAAFNIHRTNHSTQTQAWWLCWAYAHGHGGSALDPATCHQHLECLEHVLMTGPAPVQQLARALHLPAIVGLTQAPRSHNPVQRPSTVHATEPLLSSHTQINSVLATRSSITHDLESSGGGLHGQQVLNIMAAIHGVLASHIQDPCELLEYLEAALVVMTACAHAAAAPHAPRHNTSGTGKLPVLMRLAGAVDAVHVAMNLAKASSLMLAEKLLGVAAPRLQGIQAAAAGRGRGMAGAQGVGDVLVRHSAMVMCMHTSLTCMLILAPLLGEADNPDQVHMGAAVPTTTIYPTPPPPPPAAAAAGQSAAAMHTDVNHVQLDNDHALHDLLKVYASTHTCTCITSGPTAGTDSGGNDGQVALALPQEPCCPLHDITGHSASPQRAAWCGPGSMGGALTADVVLGNTLSASKSPLVPGGSGISHGALAVLGAAKDQMECEVACLAAAVLSRVYNHVGIQLADVHHTLTLGSAVAAGDAAPGETVTFNMPDGQRLHAYACLLVASPVLNVRAQQAALTSPHKFVTMKQGVPVLELSAVLDWLHTGTCPVLTASPAASAFARELLSLTPHRGREGEEQRHGHSRNLSLDRGVLSKLAKSLGLRNLATLIKTPQPMLGSMLTLAHVAPATALLLSTCVFPAQLTRGHPGASFSAVRHNNEYHTALTGLMPLHPPVETLLMHALDWHAAINDALPRTMTVPQAIPLPPACDLLLAVPAMCVCGDLSPASAEASEPRVATSGVDVQGNSVKGLPHDDPEGATAMALDLGVTVNPSQDGLADSLEPVATIGITDKVAGTADGTAGIHTTTHGDIQQYPQLTSATSATTYDALPTSANSKAAHGLPVDVQGPDVVLLGLHRVLMEAGGGQVVGAACSLRWLGTPAGLDTSDTAAAISHGHDHHVSDGIGKHTGNIHDSHSDACKNGLTASSGTGIGRTVTLPVVILPEVTDPQVAWALVAYVYTQRLYLLQHQGGADVTGSGCGGAGAGFGRCELCANARTCLRLARMAEALLLEELRTLCMEFVLRLLMPTTDIPSLSCETFHTLPSHCILTLLRDAALLDQAWAIEPLLELLGWVRQRMKARCMNFHQGLASTCPAGHARECAKSDWDVRECDEWGMLPEGLLSAAGAAWDGMLGKV